MARSFNGTTDYVENNAVTGQVGGAFSFACWAYPTSFAAFAVVWGTITTGNNTGHAYLAFETTGKCRWEVASNGSNATALDSSGALPLNAWAHLAGTVDAGNNMIVYTNGAAAGTAVAVGHNWGGYADAGRLGQGFGASFAGRVGECAVWPAVLTAAEIAALAQGTSPARIRPNSALYWPLYGVASPEPDLSGRGFNGTVTGTALANHPPVGPYGPSDDLSAYFGVASPPVPIVPPSQAPIIQILLPPSVGGALQAIEYASYFGPFRHVVQMGRQRGISMARRSG